MKVIGFDRSSNFAVGAGGQALSKDDVLTSKDSIIAWSGVGHTDVFNHIKTNNLDYYYIDTGYFGNGKHKTYKRITFNGLNDNRKIICRANDRLDRLHLNREPATRGDAILVVPPDQKVLNCWSESTDVKTWSINTIHLIKQFTDRPIVVRERAPSRADRIIHNTFWQALQQNVHAVVAWSSNCAVESILHSIPVISLGPTATTIVSPFDITQINDVPNLEQDLVYSWLKHLSYSQFTEQEMLSGLAWEYLKP